MTDARVFRIEAEPGAALLCRVIGLLAQRDLDIDAMAIRPLPQGGVAIRITLSGLDAHGAQIIAAKAERIIGVSTVALEQAPAAAPRRAA